MKKYLIKTDLQKEEIISYDSPNKIVKKAAICVFSYHMTKLYQPRIYTTDNLYLIDRCAYYNIDEAKKSIDAYNYNEINRFIL